MDLHRPLGHRPEEPDQVHLLKGLPVRDVVPDLAGEDQDRHRLGVGVVDPGGQVGRARATGHQAGRQPSRGAGEAVRHERGHLFVADGDVPDLRLPTQRVEQVHGRGSGQAEHVRHTLPPEGLDHHLGAVHSR